MKGSKVCRFVIELGSDTFSIMIYALSGVCV